MENFINRGKLKKATISNEMVLKEFRIGEKDLKSAKETFEMKNYKWATIQAYYGIYHGIRALLFKSGYREESHIALRIAFKELYIDTKIFEVSVYKTLQRGMELRELADYKESFSENGADQLITNTDKALIKIQEYLCVKYDK
jgi:uncharacterized protein (UPF0332 family)